MPVIAIVNRKGGSGKSTLAAHIAAWCARHGNSVMLGDVDRQQSARSWLKRRDESLPSILPWAVDQKNVLRVPATITHVVLDTPGGMHGAELARVVMFADAIVMPMCNSIFDRESAAQCYAELKNLPRIMSGRCQLAAVGMRVDSRSIAADSMKEWSEALGIPFLGTLRENQLYVHSLERGMTIFDLPQNMTTVDIQEWQPILQWLRPLLKAPQVATVNVNDSIPSEIPSPIAAAPQLASPVTPTSGSREFGGLRPQTIQVSRPSNVLSDNLNSTQTFHSKTPRVSIENLVPLTDFVLKPVKIPLPVSEPVRHRDTTDSSHVPHFLKRATSMLINRLKDRSAS